MAITDTDQLTEIGLLLHEDPVAWSNGLWSLTEVLGYWNQRQYRFLKETQILAAWTTIPWTPAVPEQPLPVDWIVSIAAAWRDYVSGTSFVLPSSDQFETDHLNRLAMTTPARRPQAYRDSDIETLTVAVAPPPANPGALELIYVALSDLLDGSGVLFTIPDEWVPYLKYGVLADMLGKDGRGQDLLRSRYCEQRFAEGLALAQALLGGF